MLFAGWVNRRQLILIEYLKMENESKRSINRVPCVADSNVIGVGG